MYIASGYVEANETGEVQKVVDAFKERNIEVNGINEEKIVFIIERQTSGEVKTELDALRDINGVRNVYLSYFTLGEEGETSKFTES